MRASVLVGMGAMWLTSGEDLGGSDHKESTCNAGAVGLIPRLGRSHRGGTGNPLWYTCLENSRTEEPGGLQSVGSQRVRRD